MKTLSIKLKATISLLTFFIIVIIGAYLTLSFLGSTRNDAKIIDVMGRQRMLSQAIGKAALNLVLVKGSGREMLIAASQQELEQAKQIFSQSLKALKEGGRYPADLKLKNFKELPRIAEKASQAKIKEIEQAYQQLIRVIDRLHQGRLDEEKSAQLVQKMVGNANWLRKLSNDLVVQYNEIALGHHHTVQNLVISLIVVVVVFLGIVSFVLATQIITPIGTILGMIQRLSQGDLDCRVQNNRKDEIGQIIQAINELGITLKRTIGEIVGNAETNGSLLSNLSSASKKMDNSTGQMKSMSTTIASASEQISSNMGTVAAASEEASVSVSSITATVEQLSTNMNTIAAAAEEASVNMSGISDNVNLISQDITNVTTSLEDTAESFSHVKESTAHAMLISDEAAQAANETLKSMTELGEVTQQIDQILKMVNNIASQTNMLALNATIEAASAGQAGKGFAVVAGEVKDLANQTTEANNDISIQIEQVQEYVSKSLGQTKQVSKVIQQVSQINQGISTLVGEQSEKLIQIVKATDSVSAAAQSSALNVEEAALGIKEITRSTAEASQGAKATSQNVVEAAAGVKEIARSSAEAATGVKSINRNIQDMNMAIEEAAQAVGLNLTNLKSFSKMAQGLKDTVEFFVRGGSTFFYWTDQLSVNNATVDEQHKIIIKQINALYIAKSEDRPRNYILEILGNLIKAAAEHFEDEEILFGNSSYPHTEAHIAKHKDVVNQLLDFEKGFSVGELEVDEAFMAFLKDWLLQHIMITDQSYTAYL